MMMNLKPFTLPNIDAYNMFSPSAYQQPHTHSDKNNKNQNPSQFINFKSGAINQNANQIINRPIRIVNTNNMYQEVSEFNRSNLLQFLGKIATIYSICLIFIMSGAISISLGVTLGIFSFGVLTPSHNIIRSLLLRKWVDGITLLACFMLVDHIFMGILKIHDISFAQNLERTQLHLVPCFIITVVLAFCYNALPMISIDCKRTLKQSFSFYSTSVSDLINSVTSLNLVIIKVYSLTFLATYIAVVWYNYFFILNNATNFLNVIRPTVFAFQALSFLYVILIYHFTFYFIDSLVSWSLLPKLYKNKNRFTKIPTIIELLKVNPTEKMVEELKSKRLLINFNLFSKQQSRISNNLSFQQVNNIYKRSLNWITKQIVEKGGDIKNKIEMYSNPKPIYLTQLKKQISYWDIVSEFSLIQFSSTLKLLDQVTRKIQELSVKKSNPKSILIDLFYHVRIWYGEIEVLSVALWCGQYLNICDKIFYLIAICQINLKLQGGVNVALYQQIQQISILAQKIHKTLWVNEIIREKMQRLSNKAKYILRNSTI